MFCPGCKREIYIECEYEYGPVTPCSILLGEDSIGTVTENDRNKYLLEIASNGRRIKLRKSYLDALHEVSNVMKGILRPKVRNEESNSFKILKAGGSLCFYGDWFGRPWDNYHTIKCYFYKDDVLEIGFDEGECLMVFEPLGMTNTEKEFSIRQSKMVQWSWYPYGAPKRELNKILYELRDGRVHKISRYGEQNLERRAPYFSVFLS